MKNKSMFQRTRIQLTVLNSLVFIILIGILGSVIYSYTHDRIYKGIDDSIRNFIVKQTKNNRSMQKQFGLNKDLRIGDSRILVLKWNEKNQLIDMEPKFRGPNFWEENQSTLFPKKFGGFHDIEVERKSFRTWAFQIDLVSGEKVTFQILRETTAEKEMLHTLLLIIIIGCSIGSLCAIGMGFFLAGKALVPIRNSWEKQQQFVSDASHELRTPLAVIQSKTDVLFQSPSATIEEKAIDISTISKECRRLSKLVANLLLLARSDSNQIEMYKKEFALDELLTEVVDPYTEIAAYQEKKMTLEIESKVSFIGDRERIHQMVVILLDNAMKYTDVGGTIQVACMQTNSSITIQVKDNGIGIKEEEIPKLFDRFYQGDKARTKAEGAGLGLSIASWIVEKHHGKIKVESKMNEGTCFEVILPKNQRI
ncbi:two-component sensor histidine kinase [Bacillus pseudomycoides]|uniref:histidine kinase n=1 Tax=Bacillus pseudomycoides TaxID=64104 RepID=A0AAJ1YXD7_9BACI|nr:HAMP domain-containing sensor histidine kinase [Bacillus pseudomycoides]MBD5799101.1 two-component sensor histidine kinase [Bacillus pseudomycoides]MCR8859249.1 HAMP domain-containing histidine kinase [Bacillus pseudomycoides]MDR4326399.1 HAMP domain-containing histidine kinase [Bacillus pseudomycoides]MED1473537.1 HAMP domain-containing sensor histidine kinase [Bacillus pseudomycoides]MED1537420.1 HAMP domain-containing sensor histidine kinase [Bacillus pseudomycoides]